MTLCCFSLTPKHGALSAAQQGAALDALASALPRALRMTDTPAHFGRLLFSVLFVGLKKRHSAAILKRLMQKMEQAASQAAGVTLHASMQTTNLQETGLELALDRLCAALPLVPAPK